MAKVWEPKCPRCQRTYKLITFPDEEVMMIGHPKCPQCLDTLYIGPDDLISEADYLKRKYRRGGDK